MTDRELWVKTLKTVGAMVGGTVVFLGASSLILLLGSAGGHPASTSEAHSGAAPTMGNDGKGAEGLPPTRAPRRGNKGEQPRPGESI